ncbi:MAG: M42 family metallopeptidase [Planctomycetota bacterium]|jgi:putative aminopeptidase FrvX
MLELLRELIGVHGITGYETDVRKCIEKKLPKGVKKTVDNLGNLVATVGSGPGGIIFAAHMDELGMVVADVRDDGFVRIKSLGGIDPRVMPGRVLRIKTKKGEVRGVVGVKPPHLMTPDRKEMKEVVPFEKMFLDIGAGSAKEAAKMGVEILDPVTFDKTFEVLNRKLVSARGLDDRAGCAILLEALKALGKRKPKKPVHFAFTVQEERGLRGAQLVGAKFEADYAFAIDTASSGLVPDGDRAMGQAVLGGGPAVRAIDNRQICDPAFVREIAGIAKRNRIPVQVVLTGGATDAAAFELQGPKSLPISFPGRYTHSPVETVHIDDLKNIVKLVVAIVRKYAG